MPTIWLFTSTIKQNVSPRILGQVDHIKHNYLCLRNPWVNDSVFMGKMYVAMILSTAAYTYPTALTEQLTYDGNYEISIMFLLAPFIFSPFLFYRLYFIKRLSAIYFNRYSKQIYYKRIGKLFIFDWNNTVGGIFKRTEFGGSSFSTSYALAFAPRRADGSLHQKDCLWVDSNQPTDSDVQHVAEVWEYLRHFMDHGPDKLPPPGEPNWWHRPLHAICLTPEEAWRHYAPWRTGEPVEMQGKKNWQLPFWAVLFPYNLTVAICWYGVCRLFNVRAAAPPPEAFQDATVQPVKKKRR